MTHFELYTQPRRKTQLSPHIKWMIPFGRQLCRVSVQLSLRCLKPDLYSSHDPCYKPRITKRKVLHNILHLYVFNMIGSPPPQVCAWAACGCGVKSSSWLTLCFEGEPWILFVVTSCYVDYCSTTNCGFLDNLFDDKTMIHGGKAAVRVANHSV